ncbi:aminoglycoside phosphotransferase family protein [Streptomyces sp. NBC_01465]|uniref:aminoglycoside phosphotransferase family protein n=1 Tax=Streptomyces sp. NBC_01465 TaxID=2903878 RepID=UPI002E3817A8|nr:aminoglycoside phosphotransferase family protein [Streptomyces sp. NBC_01465]
MRSPVPYGEGMQAELGQLKGARKLVSSPRSRVWRVELDAGPAVVKQFVEGPDAADRYAREVTALRLAARADPPVVPALLATDDEERLLVLEHVEHHLRPADGIVHYATALAALHATTGPEDRGALPKWKGPAQEDVTAFLALADTLEVPCPTGVSGELAALLDRLAEAPGDALLHGDPCPGNDLHTSAGVRFIDFEQASLGNGMAELAYLRIGFPTCWCVTAPPADLLDRAEAAYRTTWREARGAEPEGDLTDACVGWLIRGDALVERALRESEDHLAQLPYKDWKWGTVTARERLTHRLGVVTRRTAARPDLAGVHGLTRDLHDRVRERWPKLKPPPERPARRGSLAA